MKTRIILLVAAALAFVAAPGVKAQDSGALVDALVKKGVLTSQEGEEIRADLMKDYATTSAGKLNVGSYVTQLKLYGDARLRYELDNQRYNVNNVNTIERDRNRNRYRVRVGAEYTFTDNFAANLRLATGSERNSTNADLGIANNGTGTSNSSVGNNDFLNVDLVYLTYKKAFGFDWLTLTAGRQPLGHNIATGWTWDGDINPDGGLIKLGDFKPFDDKNFTVGSTHGIYVWYDYTDNPNNGTTPGQSREDAWLVINQVDLAYKFNSDWKLRVSPGYVTSFGEASQTIANAGGGATPPNTAMNGKYDLSNMNVFLVDAALSTPFFLENSKGNIYAEYGVNISGGARAQRINGTPGVETDGRNQFALFGYKVDIGKGKGAWSFDTTYAYYEADSWVQGLVDSDWAGNTLNSHGVGFKVGYNVTDNVNVSANYRTGWKIDGATTAATQGVAGNISSFDLVQLDLVWKF